MLINRISLRGLFGVSSQSLVGRREITELFFHDFNWQVGCRDGRPDKLHFAEDLEVTKLRINCHGLNLAIVPQRSVKHCWLATLIRTRAEEERQRVAPPGRLRARGLVSLVASDQLLVRERRVEARAQHRLGSLFCLEETLGFEL